MSTVPPNERLDKWDRKFDTARIKDILDGEKPTMKTRAGVAFHELASMEDSTKNVLNDMGVTRSNVSRYLCFAREVWKADEKYEGELLKLATAEKIGKWAGQGLSTAVLEAIRDRVFTIPAPTGP